MLKTILIFCLLVVSTAQAAQNWDIPTQLEFPQNGKILVIGDSWSNCFFQSPKADPPLMAAAGDSSLWDGGLVPYIFPNAAGNRRTDTSIQYAYRTSGSAYTWKGANASGQVLGSTALAGAKYHSAIRTWPHKLADYLGTPYWHVIAANGARLVSVSGKNNGGDWYGINNPWVGDADLIIIHLGANDIGSAASNAEELVAAMKSLLTEVKRVSKGSARVLLLGMRPWASSSVYASATKNAQADTLDAFISGRSPFSADSTGEFITADAYAAGLWPSGYFSSFSYGEYLRNYHPTNDAATSMPADTLKPMFYNGVASKTAADYVHTNVRGDNYIAQLIARHVFGCELAAGAGADTLQSDTDWLTPLYTRGAQTIYVDIENGDDIVNWMDCFSSSRPLATMQAAVWRASPGDRVEFAAGEYAQYFNMKDDGYMIPGTAHLEPTDAYVILDGNGSTMTRENSPQIQSPGQIFNSHYYYGRSDSMNILNTQWEDWTFAQWDTTFSGAPTFEFHNTQGIKFKDCTFQTSDFWWYLLQNGETTPESAVDFALEDCTVNGYDANGTGTTASFIPVSQSSGDLSLYPVNIDVTGCSITDTTHEKNYFVYTAGYPDNDTGSQVRLSFVGNTVNLQNMASSSNLFYVADTDLIFMNNYIHYEGVTSSPELIRGATGNLQDTLIFINNIIECEDAPAGSEISSWEATTETYRGNLHNLGTGKLCATAGNRSSEFEYAATVTINQLSDTVYFGGTLAPTQAGFTGYTASGSGISHGTNHASIGVTQYYPNTDIYKIGTAGEFVTTPMALLPYLRLTGATGVEATMYCSRPEVDALNLDIWLNGTHPNGSGTWEAQAQDTLKVVRVK